MRYKLTIEYDGSRYAGWQFQKEQRTVQGELMGAAFRVFDTWQMEIYGAGRTDAGVHARGQVAHLDIMGENIQPDQLKMRLNDVLPHDINILSVEKASPKFHARYDATMRQYVYQISKRRDAFGKKYVWWVRDPLNLTDMRKAADMLQGFHDFRAFGDTEKEGQSTMVDLHTIQVTEDDNRIYITFAGSHFLWKMVRRLVGVLVEVGRGRISLEKVEEFMEFPSKEPARYTAPPSGLFLEKVAYQAV
ncbi:MAG: tRNA pseudouridine(38-40) synthase TruA [Bacteroidetes bacterium]|nr:tRNA pseudouridine(38-40) synthase TruA [Bacteroidota bacterium]